MMATTLVPPPAAAPRQAPGEVRFVAIRANLMPDEVLSARQADVVRKQVVMGLIAVVVLLIGWYAMSWWQTRAANDSLAEVQRQGIALQSQQTQFTPLVHAQSEITNIRNQLQQLMVGDLSWKTMLTTLRAKAPAGVEFTSITGTVTAGAAATTTPGADGGLLNQTGSATVGQLTITGTAPDKRTVAAYADALSTVPGVTAPLIASVQAGARPVTFTITAVITSDALGGKYSTTAASGATGGN
jgi:Tfp pilus assembly protein PilN